MYVCVCVKKYIYILKTPNMSWSPSPSLPCSPPLISLVSCPCTWDSLFCSRPFSQVLPSLEGHRHLIGWEKLPPLFRHLTGRNFPSSSSLFTFSLNAYQIWLPCWLSRWLSGKESTCSAGEAGEVGSIPEWGSSPGEGNDNPLQYSCLGNPRDRGAWQATVRRGAKSP